MAEEAERYAPRRASRNRTLATRGLDLHIREYGPDDGPPLVLLHGGADASITFQFLIDAFRDDWHVVAPDWRGHGRSGWSPNGYVFADYLIDLDLILATLFATTPVPLVGHSLGGNVATVYAGIRPERLASLVSLDGFGLPDPSPDEAPAHLRRTLDAWAETPTLRTYPTLNALAERLLAANPRLDGSRALFLAGHLARETAEGWTWAFDPGHRRPFASLYRKAEFLACWAAIAAPTLFIGSDTPFPPGLAREEGGLEARFAHVRDHRFVRIEGAGHNLHHDAPERVAALVEEFLRTPPRRAMARRDTGEAKGE